MKNSLEYVLLIALIVLALVIKETADIPKADIIYSGIIIALAVTAATIYQTKSRARALRFFGWLYTCDNTLPESHTIRKIERNVKPNSNIYLVSADLYNDARSSKTQAVVLSNLARGVIYRYIVKDDNEDSESNINEVMHCFRDFSDNINIYSGNDVFGSLPTRNVLIIEHDHADHLRVFIELPVVEQNVRNWWIEADAVIARQWHKKILEILQGRQPKVSPYLKIS